MNIPLRCLTVYIWPHHHRHHDHHQRTVWHTDPFHYLYATRKNKKDGMIRGFVQ